MRAPRLTAAGRWRRRLAATLALVIAIAVIIAVILGARSPSSPSAATNASSSSGATTVQRRDLVQTDTESGTLSYANSYTVYDHLSGTITWLPAVGQVIKPGQALYDVGGAPVILMDGTTPAYRDLNSSDSAGPDILELNRNLVRLGFNPGGIVVDDEWQPATTEGVDLFQESLGETQTGDLTLGQVVFLPGDQVISSLETTLGSNGGGTGGNGSPTAYDLPTGAAQPEFVGLTKPSGSPTSGPAPSSGAPSQPCPSHRPKTRRKPCNASGKASTLATLRALLNAATAQLRAETAELKAAQGGNGPSGKGGNSPGGKGGNPGAAKNSGNAGNGGNGGNSGNSGNTGNSGNGGNSPGSGGGSATAIMQTSSTQLVVTVDLDATKQSEAKVGEPVTVELPNGSTVNGKITAVSPVAQSSSSSGNGGGGGGGNGNGNNGNNASGATIPVTIALSGHHSGAGLDQAAVSVNFAQARAHNVLSVPVTALLATAGGGYAVQEAAAPHTLIPVTTGLFAAGYVEISGPGIYPGLAVTDSQG